MNPPFNGWRAGAPFYGPVLVLGFAASVAAALWTSYPWAGLPVLGLGVAMALFFRDFPRAITAAENEVVAPADGKVVAVEDIEDTPHYEGPCRRISIFLSVFDAHVNRAPYGGVVKDVRYAPGRYVNAMRADSSKLNESNAVWLDTRRGAMTVRQISGAVARRIVCPVEPGAALDKGEKFGMIRFGSRTELYLPPGTEATVQPGDRVRAGLDVVARFR